MTVAIAYPFNLDPVGVVDWTNNSTKIYLDRVLTLLSTNVGQRPMLQKYGTNLSQALFENENRLAISVDQAIRTAIGEWLPQIEVKDIVVGSPDTEGVASVEVFLLLPNSVSTSISITTATFHSDGTITR